MTSFQRHLPSFVLLAVVVVLAIVSVVLSGASWKSQAPILIVLPFGIGATAYRIWRVRQITRRGPRL